jgi:cell wall-associated NlpC family hydrolase
VTQGCPVPFDAFERADLVFFGERGPESPRVTHVGMMLDGRRFIHARGGECVQIGALDEEHWRQRLAAARRVLDV